MFKLQKLKLKENRKKNSKIRDQMLKKKMKVREQTKDKFG